MKSACPICKNEMTVSEDYLDGHILMESTKSCPQGHYSFEYITGVTTIQVGGFAMSYSYLSPDQEVARAHDIVDKLVERYKRQKGTK